jgi:hypothetical protein
MPKFRVQLSQKRWEFCDVIVEAADADAARIAAYMVDESELNWELCDAIEREVYEVQTENGLTVKKYVPDDE